MSAKISSHRHGAGLKLLQRNLPPRGFRPGYVLFAVAGVMTYGFWKLGKGIREQKYASPFVPHRVGLHVGRRHLMTRGQ